MPQFLKLLEAYDRRVRMGTNGAEIETTWYCEPAAAAPLVIAQLLGGVTGNTANDRRILPAHDHAFPYCYCTDAHEAPMDPRAVANSPACTPAPLTGNDANDINAALAKPIIFDGPLSLKSDGSGYQQFNAPGSTDNRGRCGAYIQAFYRPIYSVYNNTTAAIDLFDCVDPQFTPSSRVFPGNGIPGKQNSFCTKDDITQLLDEAPGGAPSGILITETWQEFTIRRVMCPSVPWVTIRSLEGRINDGWGWQPQYFTVDGLENNTFPQGTLRFDYAETTPRLVPAAAPNPVDGVPVTAPRRCYDILYHFSWRTTFSQWCDIYFRVQPPAYISWNCDWYQGCDVTLLQGIFGALFNEPCLPGWYEMNFEQPTNQFISLNTRKKYLNAWDLSTPLNTGRNPAGVNTPFDSLFRQDAV